jgi:transcriptional regulator with XRE-family HTH domain
MIMSEKRQNQPFKQLGDRLKTIRQKLHESLSEVSGAVEIDEPTLTRIEQGDERPTEDILMLLISHFGMQDDEAAGLWQLAGYDQPRSHDHDNDDVQNSKATILVMAVDPRVIYSDGVQVSANRNGVTISFSQGNGSPNSLITARVGMSRDQAKAVIRTLQDAISRSEPRQLPGSIDKKDNQTK